MKCCKITAYLILFLLVGCGSTKKSSDTGGLGEPCHPDGTCEEPYICEQDLCRSPDNGNNNLNNNNENNNVNNNNNHNNNNNGLVEPTITVTTSMTAEEAYTAIESAEEGDVVFIEPGIYQFRVYLANSGTPENPILIRGSDPENPPIFDYEGRDCDQWPGSDSGRLHYWAWQIQGSYITIENLVIRHARMDSDMNRSSAGIFIGPETIYAEPTPDDTIPRSITLRNIEIYGCDDGLQGTAEGTLVETCVLHSNGTQFSSRPRHNVYLQGGSATFRFCHVFDPTSGANLTLRTRDFRMEYSKLGEFVSSHSIQVLTNKAQQTNGESYQQTITLIGNEFDGHRNHENGMSKFIILLNSNSYVGNRMHANLFYNTFNGASGNMGSFVQLAVQNGTEALGAYVYNNIAINNQRPIRIESGHSYTDPLYDIDVRNNWWPAGNYDAWSEVMSDNIFGGDPFTESAGKANTDLGEIPSHEPLGPVRSSVVDPGAYSLE